MPELDSSPTPLEFYRLVFDSLFPVSFLFRDWVSPNLPVIIRGGAAHFPALKNWSPELLRSRIGNASVTVAVTPNGLADAPQGDQFVMPEERTMKMEEFLDIIENPDTKNGVFYI